jgi:hypothetical protein
MPETESLPQEVKEQIDKIGSADIVIGLPAYKAGEELGWMAGLADIGLNVAIAHPSDGVTGEVEQLHNVSRVRYVVPVSERYLSNAFGSFHEVLQIGQRMKAKACCVWNSNSESVTVDALQQMLRPIFEEEIDWVVPRYVEARLGTLVNSSILRPVIRALYGKRIHFPMALDLCFSAKFVSRLLQTDPRTRISRSQQWIATEAICNGFSICEVNLLKEPPRLPESADLSSVLAAVLSRMFLDLERNMQFWQRSNTSQSVPAFGRPEIKEEEGEVDVQRLIETFKLAYRNLADIWRIALTPATLIELKKLTIQTPANFHMADDLWVRVVYDFALAHRQRAINVEHLLRAMTPLYLAWVASYALETKETTGNGFEDKLEGLGLAYEKQRPYLLSRWRWPDRFNP